LLDREPREERRENISDAVDRLDDEQLPIRRVVLAPRIKHQPLWPMIHSRQIH
jgi:hypothetical protein